jgi:TolA-binding protein
MFISSSSRRTFRPFSRARMRLIVAVHILAAVWGLVLILAPAAIAGDPIQLVRFSEENLPAQDLPKEVPGVVATPEAGPAGDWVVAPGSAPANSAPASSAPDTAGGAAPPEPPSAASSPSPDHQTNAAQLEPTPVALPTDVAPLEVGSVAPQSQISDMSLQPLLQKVSAAQPALAASLRLTDQARGEISANDYGGAIQTLTRAISIDGSNSYAYFYLGRAYLAKKNYPQAITFLKRAEIGFGTNAEWLGETLAFEGLASEQAGDTASAIACYQKAVVSVPGNLMARVGLTRLGGSEQAAPAVQPVSTASGNSSDQPPPAEPPVPPPPDSPPPPPAN